MRLIDDGCRCPDAGDLLRAELTGVEPGPCPLHDEAGRQAATERARLDAYQSVVTAVRADLAEAAPEPLSPRQQLEQAIRDELEPDPTSPPALALNDDAALTAIVRGAFGAVSAADPRTPIDGGDPPPAA